MSLAAFTAGCPLGPASLSPCIAMSTRSAPATWRRTSCVSRSLLAASVSMSRWKPVPDNTIVSVPLLTPPGTTWASIPPSIGFFLLMSSTTRCQATPSSDDGSGGVTAGAARSAAADRSTGTAGARGGIVSRPPAGRASNVGRGASVAAERIAARRAVDRLQRRSRLVRQQRRRERAHLGGRGGAEQTRGRVGLEAPVAIGDGGVEQRQGVAQRALRRAHDRGQRRRLEGDLLLGQDVLERGRQGVRRDRSEVEALDAREHGGRDVARIGG